MSDQSFTQVSAPAKDGGSATPFETHCFDAEELRTSHGIDASKCSFVELGSSTRLYPLVVAHLGEREATSCSFAPRVTSNTQSRMEDILGNEAPNKNITLEMGLGVSNLIHTIDGIEHTISAVHQRRGPIVGTSCGASTWQNLVLFVEGRGPAARRVLTHLLETLVNQEEDLGESQVNPQP